MTQTLDYVITRKKGQPPVTELDRIQRLISVTNDIVGIAKDFGVRYVAIEGYAHAAKFQSHQVGEIGGNVKTQLWLGCGIVPYVIPPASARKSVFGYGGSIEKQEIVDAVNACFGVKVANDHEADSVVVAKSYFDTLVSEMGDLE